METDDNDELIVPYIQQVFSKTGIKLSVNEDLNVLIQEQALVVREFEKCFGNTEESVEQFLTELKIFCKNEDDFRKALCSTMLKKTDTNTGSTTFLNEIEQDSIFRILLRVSCLQNGIVQILLEELTNISSEEKLIEDTSSLRLILSQFRHLFHINEPETVRTTLLDILEIVPLVAQLEILNYIPQILPDSQYHHTATQLCSLLDNDDSLSVAILDCLNCLHLSSDHILEVQDIVLAKLSTNASLNLYAVCVEFLLSDPRLQELPQILIKIRDTLNTIMLQDSCHEKDSDRILIFDKLQTITLCRNVILDGWLQLISNIKQQQDHKPIDHVLLFMLHSKNMKQNAIEQLYRKKISTGVFKVMVLENSFHKCLQQQLFKDYFNSMLEIAFNITRTSNHEVPVLDFAITFFNLLFNHNYTEVIYRQEILDRLLQLAAEGNYVTLVLNIFSTFLNEHANFEKLQRHTITLMRLLKQIHTFEIKDVRTVYEILCTLTCNSKSDSCLTSSFRDEIHMIIRKQLSVCKRSVRHQGIIAAVVMAKHVASSDVDNENNIQDDMDTENDAVTSIDQLPVGAAREAATLLDLTRRSTCGVPELIGLYYDQLAMMLVTPKPLNIQFMRWLNASKTDDFEKLFIVDNFTRSHKNLEFSVQYLLNSVEEMDASLNINIAELTISNIKNDSCILLLAPHFRLVRLLHARQYSGDLRCIDALLGCGVILPQFDFAENVLEPEDLKIVADCLFHCANWFREIISGFVLQKCVKLRCKVLQRLNNLIDIENMLETCMGNIHEHKLPLSYFDGDTQKSHHNLTIGKETMRKKRKLNPTIETQTQDICNFSQKKKTSTNIIGSPLSKYMQFRQLDVDVVTLLKYPLKLDDENSEDDSLFLNINQIIFILSDFNSKLSVHIQGKTSTISNRLSLSDLNPFKLLEDCVKIIPNLDKHLQVIASRIDPLIKSTGERHDLPELYTDDSKNLKMCFGLIMEFYELIFSWSGFHHIQHIELLRDILKSLRNEKVDESSQTLNSANRLIFEIITNQLANMSEYCLHLDHAVRLIKIMESLYSLTVTTPPIRKKIVETCSKLLNKRWYNSNGVLDSGKNCNANIAFLVKIYLNGANVKTICGLVATLQEQVHLLKTKEDHLNMLASIDIQNFYVFYSGLCAALCDRIKIELADLTNSEHLTLWHTTALTMQGLMIIVKTLETKNNLAIYLKKSIAILKIFLSHGIPKLEIMLRSKPDDVMNIFKAIQISTRFLHQLCCHSMVVKDSSLVAHVPQFRLTIETLLYRVKAALVANNCSAAFWMGCLRNKDLHGQEILSQSIDDSENGSQDNNDILSNGDSDEDLLNDEADNLSDLGCNKSDSEVFE